MWISDSTLVYAFQTIARGWRTQEPEELEPPARRGQRERARRFERLCYRALAEGLISLTKAAELLRLPVPEVETRLKGPQKADEDHRQRQQLPHRSQALSWLRRYTAKWRVGGSSNQHSLCCGIFG